MNSLNDLWSGRVFGKRLPYNTLPCASNLPWLLAMDEGVQLNEFAKFCQSNVKKMAEAKTIAGREGSCAVCGSIIPPTSICYIPHKLVNVWGRLSSDDASHFACPQSPYMCAGCACAIKSKAMFMQSSWICANVKIELANGDGVKSMKLRRSTFAFFSNQNKFFDALELLVQEGLRQRARGAIVVYAAVLARSMKQRHRDLQVNWWTPSFLFSRRVEVGFDNEPPAQGMVRVELDDDWWKLRRAVAAIARNGKAYFPAKAFLFALKNGWGLRDDWKQLLVKSGVSLEELASLARSALSDNYALIMLASSINAGGEKR